MQTENQSSSIQQRTLLTMREIGEPKNHDCPNILTNQRVGDRALLHERKRQNFFGLSNFTALQDLFCCIV
ncbi:MAG: hypothetical protein KDB00_14260, partial [Planctomycetales bacterium]|nr:hypothetical protein [Planctomycetales bacterium]